MTTIISVSELNTMIKDELKTSFTNKISVKGEISGYKKYGTTIYANLKDDSAIINIIKFKYNMTDKFNNGDLVIATGNIDFYIKNGNINLVCSSIELMGEGNILKHLEKIKLKYNELGYFDNKKPFPLNIKSIGIITAKDGAALQDILFVLNSNKFNGSVYIKNSSVQGNECPNSICSGIQFFNIYEKKVDIIMITRGGGSIDDLMGFSDPIVVEAIHKSNIFTMSAVGHEVDNMLSDYVADIRAPTPSIGAELICKKCINKELLIDNYKNKLSYGYSIIKNKLTHITNNLSTIKNKMYISVYEKNNKMIDNLDNIFSTIIQKRLDNIHTNIDMTKSNFELIKNNEYNMLLIHKRRQITNIDDIYDGIYDIKMNGKIRKINIKILD